LPIKFINIQTTEVDVPKLMKNDYSWSAGTTLSKCTVNQWQNMRKVLGYVKSCHVQNTFSQRQSLCLAK
jgi:hypothetical protein